MTRSRIVIGTRQSQLATWQAEHVAARLRILYPQTEIALKFFVTQGDRVLDKALPEIGGKGVFTAELESALLSGEIDLAVHSLKDLPTEMADGFTVGAVPERASPYDVLISREKRTLMALSQGATVGTSSLRRVAQIKAARPDLSTLSLRGNVPTRINKVHSAEGPYDAIVLAQAGLERIDRGNDITEVLSPEIMLPAPGQGALAVQCRADDHALLALLRPLEHAATRLAVDAERAFLNALDAGCTLPVAALGIVNDTRLLLTGRVANLEGDHMITVSEEATVASPQHAVELGTKLAAKAIQQGADKLLAAFRGEIGT